MANAKLRLFLLRDFFYRNTDETHTVTVPELIAYLNKEGVAADRRTVYADIALLKRYGLDIVKRRSKTHDYYLAAREFELPELKLLVDAVQASRFLSLKKSSELIEKLSAQTSRHCAAQLARQVYVKNRIKTGNERIYYNIDSIHRAIQSAQKISFQYCQYTLDKSLQPRRGGALYVVSPYLLTYADDHYYLIADHPEHAGLAHFRVDKMLCVNVLTQPREPLKATFDPVRYVKSMFSMFAGEQVWAEMRFDNALIGVVIDRFGVDIPIVRHENDTFSVRALVSVSPAFFGWMFQFGDRACVVSPEHVRLRMAEQLAQAQRRYEQ